MVQETEQVELNRIYNEDCKITLNRIPNKFLNGIITSPPYNINTERSDCYYNNGYSAIDNLSVDDYLNLRLVEFKEFERCLSDSGVICYNISYHKENPVLPTLLISQVHNNTNLTVADIISWKKNTAIPFQTSPTKLSRIVELIYVLVKKDSLHTFTTNKIINSVNKKTGQNFYKNYTNFIEAANNDGFKSDLKASFSQELVNKLIHIYYPTGSRIYDPFIGIGTTALSCVKNNLHYIGSEIVESTFKTATKRLLNDI